MINTVEWNNPNYIGTCQLAFYPLIAFGSPFDPGARYAIDRKAITIDGNSTFEDNLKSGDMSNYKYTNFSLDSVSIDYSLYQWYNTSITRNDLLRVKWFQNDTGISKWRIDNVILTDTDGDAVVEIIVARNIGKWAEKVFVKNKKKREINVTTEGNRFLCVFNDGTVILSKPMKRRYGFTVLFIIECDLNTNNTIATTNNATKVAILKQKIFEQWNQRSKNITQQQAEQEQMFTTNIGLTLFSLGPKGSHVELINEFLISSNIQLPICSGITVNNQPQVFASEKQYKDQLNKLANVDVASMNDNKNVNYSLAIDSKQNFETNNHNNMNWHSVDTKWLQDIKTGSIASINNNTSKTSDGKFKYYFSIAAFLHPSSRSGQQVLLAQQWIDYHLFMGIEHFYLFDHLFRRSEDDINVFWYMLQPYINQGFVTYFQLPMSMRPQQSEEWYFQMSAYLYVLRLVRYQTQYVIMTDIDEWIIIHDKVAVNTVNTVNTTNKSTNINSIDKLPSLKEIYQSNATSAPINYHVLMGYTSLPNVQKLSNMEQSTKQLGCDKNDISNKYDTFLQRQSCFYSKIENKDILQSMKQLDNYPNSETKNDGDVLLDLITNRVLRQIAISAKNMNDDALAELVEEIIHGKDRVEFERYKKAIEHFYDEDTYEVELPASEANVRSKVAIGKGYEIQPKLIIDPRVAYIGFQHYMTGFINIEKSGIVRYDNKKSRYEIFLAHLTDHMKGWNAKRPMLQGNNKLDAKFFQQMTQTKCHFENSLLYWNTKFLNSQYGRKYVNKTMVNPLMDKDNVMCFFK